MGHMLNDYLKQKVINICMPGASYNQIVDRILSGQYSANTTLVLLIGNSLYVTENDLIRCYDTLSTMEIKKTIICAFPYSASRSHKQNTQIHELNMLIFNMTFGHREQMMYFDTNKFIHNFILTKSTLLNLYLSFISDR